MGCFYNCCRQTCCPETFRPIGIIGPQGPMGPVGPTGATGPAGITANNIASFVNNGTTPVLTTATVPLNDIANLTNGNVTHVVGSDTVNLSTVGYYLVSYNTTATSATAGNVSLGALLNGASVLNSISNATIVANSQAMLNAEFIVQAITPNSSLTLSNTGTNSTTYNPLNLVVQYLQ